VHKDSLIKGYVTVQEADLIRIRPKRDVVDRSDAPILSRLLAVFKKLLTRHADVRSRVLVVGT